MMAKLTVIVVALAFLGVLALGTGLIAQQRTGGGVDRMDPAIKALIEARIEVAIEAYETTMEPPGDAPLDDMPVWSHRWMDETIKLYPNNPSKRIAATQDHLDRIRGLEAIAEGRAQAARGRRADILKVKYYRLEAEQMLAELRIINPGLFPPKPAARP